MENRATVIILTVNYHISQDHISQQTLVLYGSMVSEKIILYDIGKVMIGIIIKIAKIEVTEKNCVFISILHLIFYIHYIFRVTFII